MRILFNAMGSGLGPNGGSATIVNSANALTKLGHEVFIIDGGPNKHTWTKLKCKHLIIKDRKQIPKSDVAITTGFNTCKSTLTLPAKIKVMWLRAWETWKTPEKQIVETLLPLPLIKIVNSIGLQDKLKHYGHDSEVIRPGHTIKDFFPKELINGKYLILGGLYHTKHLTKRHIWCIEAAKTLKKKYPNLRLYMFGVSNIPKMPDVDLYLHQPEQTYKNYFYNDVDIWLSPSNLEGLHITPAEASLCEVPVVTTNALLAGTKDYVIHRETGLVSEDNLSSFINQIEILIKNKKLRKQLGKAARQKIISLGNREENMKKMVNLFERYLQ